jgi:hypothetical protein
MIKRLGTALVTLATVAALSACEVEEPASDGAGGGSGSSSSSNKADNFTVSQKSAIQAAENYLDTGMGYSRNGLIEQLTSKMGSGFKRADAVFAIKQIKPNWNKQAVMAAKNYMETGMGYSRDGLLEQLTSKMGSGFTQAQAEFAVNKVGL